MGSAANTGQQLRDACAALFTAMDSTGLTEVADVLSRVQYNWTRILDGAAGTDYQASGPVTKTQFKVDTVTFTPNAAVTHNGATYSTLTLVYNDGAGGGDTTIAAVDTSANDWTAGQKVTLTLTAANVVVPKGKQLSLKKTHASTGTVLADGCIDVAGYVI